MAMTCEDLFTGIECAILGDSRQLIGGLAYRSDQVKPGDVFFCIVGTVVDGHTFAQDAIDRGAKALVAERKVYLADASDVVEIIVSDSRKAMAKAASNFYGDPSKSFSLVGVTGTNGKTTTTYLVDEVVRRLGHRSGLIGSVGNAIDGVMEKSAHTTPESADLQRLFARYRDEGCSIVTMEVSSHGLALKRPWSSHFAVTAFTNLTQDHLDYHHSFDEYFEAKAKLFSSDYPAIRVINISDKRGEQLRDRCAAAGDRVITTGLDDRAHIHPLDVDYRFDSTWLRLSIDGRPYETTYPLIGSFNVENVMTALGILRALDMDIDRSLEALAYAPQVPGRLDRLPQSDELGFNVYVDYAHTPDAIEKAIASIRLISDGRIWIVFGCEGDRDREKRPLMGEASLAADRIIVTNDAPRGEDPQTIIEAILPALAGAEDRFEVISDRRSAITRALDSAGPGDNIIIAGHGHEDVIVMGDKVIPFNDIVVTTEIIENRQRRKGESR